MINDVSKVYPFNAYHNSIKLWKWKFVTKYGPLQFGSEIKGPSSNVFFQQMLIS